jgi:hypothetical protein
MNLVWTIEGKLDFGLWLLVIWKIREIKAQPLSDNQHP